MRKWLHPPLEKRRMEVEEDVDGVGGRERVANTMSEQFPRP